jgi:Holliday junction resolvasome RuvABC endonuclease subunit
MIVLSFDPGGSNFGLAVTKISKKRSKYLVLYSGMLKCPIKDLKGDWTAEVVAFEKEVKSIIRKFKPTHFIAERYVLRKTVTGGTTTEGISMMLGIAGLILKKIKCKLITAALWKNAIGRAFGKESLKLWYKTDVKTVCTPHQFDAALIGLYLMWDTKHYTGFSKEKLLKQISCVNNNPLQAKKTRHSR